MALCNLETGYEVETNEPCAWQGEHAGNNDFRPAGLLKP